jgi:hypothetical protein
MDNARNRQTIYLALLFVAVMIAGNVLLGVARHDRFALAKRLQAVCIQVERSIEHTIEPGPPLLAAARACLPLAQHDAVAWIIQGLRSGDRSWSIRQLRALAWPR